MAILPLRFLPVLGLLTTSSVFISACGEGSNPSEGTSTSEASLGSDYTIDSERLAAVQTVVVDNSTPSLGAAVEVEVNAESENEGAQAPTDTIVVLAPALPEQPVVPSQPEQPTAPEQPATPEQPPEPEQPDTPEQPPEPEQPETPEQPPEPEQPETPEQPPEPEQPDAPEQPPEPEQPDTPEQPPEPEQPDTPEQPPEPEQPSSEIISIGSVYPSQQPLRIFPGAEGFGTTSVGGRGGRICKVTNLNEAGPGSLRECAESSGPRIVVFETGGTIEVTSAIQIVDPFISIYGQTAPGDGILVRASLDSVDTPLTVKTHDVLIQHIRFRAGTTRQVACCRDALSVASNAVGAVYNVVIDHNSLSWGTDQLTNTWYDTHDVTFSNNIISESLYDNGSSASGPAGRGFLVGSGGAHSISIHNNLFAHSFQRNPLVKTSGIVDITNNLIYHWISRGGQQHATYSGQKVNWVKNHYIAKEYEPNATAVGWGDILLISVDGHALDAYFLGNIGYNRPSNDLPEYQIANTSWGEPYDPALSYHSDTRFPAPPISEVNALDLEQVMSPHVGASAPKRDAVDTRVMSQLASRTGKMPNCVAAEDRPGDPRCNNNLGGWPTMSSGVAKSDSDNDGIPDEWEVRFGLNPQVDDSRQDINNDGFTNIEDYAFDAGKAGN